MPTKSLPTKWLSAALLLLSGVSAYACLDGIEMAANSVTLNDPSGPGGTTGGTVISFQQSYTNPPLVFLLPHNDNSDPSSVRIQSVTTSGFTVGIAETPGEDGVTANAPFSYLVVDPGPTGSASFTLDGQQIDVGTVGTTAFQSKLLPGSSYTPFNFTSAFPSGVNPILIHELQSFANDPTYNFNGGDITEPWYVSTALQANVTNAGAQVALERAETLTGTIINPETIAYLAITPGTGNFADGAATVDFNAFITADNISGNCTNNAHGLANTSIAVANKARRDGGDGSWLRQCSINGSNISLRALEDQSGDTEQNHTTESAAVFAFSQPFAVDLSATSGPMMEAGTAVANPQTFLGNLNFTHVTFPQAFSEVPLVFTLPTTEEPDPASLRVRNITVNGFDVAQVQPQNEAGAANSMTIDYLAITPKTHTVPVPPNSFATIEAGSFNTATIAPSYDLLSFNHTFDAPPALLLDIQTLNSEPALNPSNVSTPWLEVAVRENSITAGQAQVGLDRAETTTGTVVSETIAYLAIESNQSLTLSASNGSSSISVIIKSLLTPSNILGPDNAPSCFANTYPGGAFSTTPLAIANSASRNGNNGGWIRRCSNNPAQLGLVFDEDRAADTERNHTTEQASLIAFSEDFLWCPNKIQVTKTSNSEHDPFNLSSNPKSIPGALVAYNLDLENRAAPALTINSTMITDPIPAGTVLYVQADPSQGNIAPFDFDPSPGTAPSGLNFTYSGPASTTDDVAFSNDGGATFNYQSLTPVNGTDTAITHVRINPKGVFNGMNNAVDVPAFSVKFHVVVE